MKNNLTGREYKYTFSWSNGQPNFTIRCDNSVELANAIDKALPQFKRFKNIVEEKPQQVNNQQQDVMANQVCSKCGAKLALSKKGNWYCVNKCWLK